jgi:acetyl esterase/lipase
MRAVLRAPRVPAAVGRAGARQIGQRVLNPGLPWEVQRRRLDRVMGAMPVPRGTTVAGRSIGGVPAEVVTADGAGTGRTVVHFHGGGYCVGSARLARTWAAHLSARAACRVVLPEYRLAPAYPYPAALDDARDLMKTVFSEVFPGSVVVSGDSAGGGLALAVALAMRDGGEALPAGCILISPWLDLGREALPELARRDVLLSPAWLRACATAYTDPSNWASPSVSPLLAAHGGLPPLLIQAGSHEVLLDDATRLAAKAAADDVAVTLDITPGVPHVFQAFAALLDEGDAALNRAARFINDPPAHKTAA